MGGALFSGGVVMKKFWLLSGGGHFYFHRGLGGQDFC